MGAESALSNWKNVYEKHIIHCGNLLDTGCILGLFFFFSHISVLFSFSLSLGNGPIHTEILSLRAISRKQLTNKLGLWPQAQMEKKSWQKHIPCSSSALIAETTVNKQKKRMIITRDCISVKFSLVHAVPETPTKNSFLS